MDDFLKGIANDHRNDLFTSANDGFDMSLEIIGYDLPINGIIKKVILEDKGKTVGTERVIAAKVGDISIGDIVIYKNQSWLIADIPVDNDVYLKAPLKQCNSTYPIKANKTRLLKRDAQGNPVLDKFGDPAYIYTDGQITNLPCIAESSFVGSDENKQLSLPQGQLRITMQYQNVDDIKVNNTFSMYNNVYKIRNIDYTKVINNKGIVVLSVEQVTSEVK